MNIRTYWPAFFLFGTVEVLGIAPVNELAPIEALTMTRKAKSNAIKQDALLPPSIALKDISILSLNLDAVSIGVKLHVKNPNKEDLVVEELRYQLSLEETLVKSGAIVQLERFPANSQRDVQIPVFLPYDRNVPIIFNAIRTMSANYQIKGEIKIQSRTEPLPFVHRGKLSVLSNKK